MRLRSNDDSKIKDAPTKPNDFLSSYQNLCAQVTKVNKERLSWYSNTLKKYFNVMDTYLTDWQKDAFERISSKN